MKLFKTLAFLLISVVLLTSFTNCKSSKEAMSTEGTEQSKEENTSQDKYDGKSLIIKDTYYQLWTTGQESSGSGMNIYFPTLINKSNYKLEKVYFRGMIGDMLSGKASYFANLKPKKVDLVMSNEGNAEYGNTMPTKPEPFPFKLKPTECKISYIDNGETKYFLVNNIVEKAGEYYPTAPPKQNKD